VCDILTELAPPKRAPYRELITFVKDRPGHDRRYAIDPTKIGRTLGWSPETPFEQGLAKTVAWYVENRRWCDRITQGVYRRERLGLGGA
jgi:dTDP-glucose 4,6-dehydratase